MHRRGIATLLLEHLVSLGRARGVKILVAEVLPDNYAVLGVLSDAGLAVRRRSGNGVVELSMPVPANAALGEASAYLDAVAGREKLQATFAVHHPSPGQTGLAVQSGGVGAALVEQFSRLGIGTSSFASVGDMLDVSGTDMLLWWEADHTTELAVLYLESFGNPRGFARTARRVSAKIPVLTVHAGRSAPGQRAAASHTAAAAAPLITRQALFDQAGIIATTSFGELLDAVVLMASQPPGPPATAHGDPGRPLRCRSSKTCARRTRARSWPRSWRACRGAAGCPPRRPTTCCAAMASRWWSSAGPATPARPSRRRSAWAVTW